jgi:histidine triad (HIT) family protein
MAPADCPFCLIGAGQADTDLVAYRTGGVFVVPTRTQRAPIPARSSWCRWRT